MYSRKASAFAATAAIVFAEPNQLTAVHAILRGFVTKQRHICVLHLRYLSASVIHQQRDAMDGEFKPFPHFATSAVHTGQEPEQWNSRAVIPPISMSTTFKQFEPAKFAQFEYGRSGNPSRQVTETCIASLEKGEKCYLFSSGLAATTAVTQMLNAGDHIVAMNDLYGGTNRFFRKIASKANLEASLIDATDVENVKAAMKPNTKLVWIETPTNPLLRIVDIAAVCQVAHQQPGVFVVVDNTFATPYFQRPLEMGADIVLHSLTKYMNGHSDVVMGALITNNNDLAQQIKFVQFGKYINSTPVQRPFFSDQLLSHLETGLT